MYLEQPVSDNDRTFSFALDRAWAWGFGAGMLYTRENGSRIDLNLTAIKSGDKSIDTGAASALAPRGRVAGKDHSPWALALEFTYHAFWE